jgi:uncharacterized protein YoxC
MTQQILLSYLWTVIVALMAIVLAIFVLVLWEVRKTAKVVADVARRIEMLSDIKGWFEFFRFFGKKKK